MSAYSVIRYLLGVLRHLLAVVAILHFFANAADARPQAAVSAPGGYSEQLLGQAKQLKLHELPTWHRLLHYRSGILGTLSEADGKHFFLADSGRSDPAAELEATLAALFKPPPNRPDPIEERGKPNPPSSTPGAAPNSAPARKTPDSPTTTSDSVTPSAPDPEAHHAICRFPARFIWLARELSIDAAQLPKVSCPELAEYLQLLGADSLTLVFSSYYLNNPASAFGHTFLRVNKAADVSGERQQLLDYGINYSANVDTNFAPLYALKGLLGMFPGTFQRIPYYYKVREYNDYEERDIWEYELNLSRQEANFVVAHLWELGWTYFSYFYLTENCSYHILGALEVARPDLNLLDHVGWPVLPADTVKALYHTSDLVKEVAYRPSARTLFAQRLDHLESAEVEALRKVMADPSATITPPLTAKQEVRVLDAALDLTDSKFARELLKDDTQRDQAKEEFKQQLLLRRAQTLVQGEEFRIKRPERKQPHLGHGSKRIQLGPGWGRRRGASFDLTARVALRDIADPPLGYPELLQIEFLPVHLRYQVESPRVRLQDAQLLRILSLEPWSEFNRAISWGVNIGATRLQDDGCASCLVGQLGLAGGATFATKSRSFSVFALGHFELSGLGPIEGGLGDLPLRTGLGPRGGLRLQVSDHLVGVLKGQWLYLPFQEPKTAWSAEAVLRFQYVQNFAWSLEGGTYPNNRHARLLSSWYF